jgi:hypothetical protein
MMPVLESERDDDWGALKAMRKEAQVHRSQLRSEWEQKFDRGELVGWTRFSETHYRFVLNGLPLDYWPGKKKWQYQGKIHKGDVLGFIQRRVKS